MVQKTKNEKKRKLTCDQLAFLNDPESIRHVPLYHCEGNGCRRTCVPEYRWRWRALSACSEPTYGEFYGWSGSRRCRKRCPYGKPHKTFPSITPPLGVSHQNMTILSAFVWHCKCFLWKDSRSIQKIIQTSQIEPENIKRDFSGPFIIHENLLKVDTFYL